MLLALLAVLGVDLIVILVLLGVMVSRQTGMIHACARFVLVWVLTPISVTRA